MSEGLRPPTPEEMLAQRTDALRADVLVFWENMRREVRAQAINQAGPGQYDVTFAQGFHAWTIQQMAALSLSVEALTNAMTLLHEMKR